MLISWSKKVSEEFVEKVIKIANTLSANPSYLMACMAFETAETFSPSIKNAAGSGATGLIQFMPSTAIGLGTTVDELALMTDVEQLSWVEKYFLPYQYKLHTIEDTYMAILLPSAIGKPNDYVLFSGDTTAYRQNSGLDNNSDGKITKGECSKRVREKLVKGLSNEYCKYDLHITLNPRPPDIIPT